MENVAPGHCTGEPTFAALKQAFGGRYLYAGVGTTLAMGPSMIPGERRGEAPPLDENDLTSYRQLAAREDPFGALAWRMRIKDKSRLRSVASGAGELRARQAWMGRRSSSSKPTCGTISTSSGIE